MTSNDYNIASIRHALWVSFLLATVILGFSLNSEASPQGYRPGYLLMEVKGDIYRTNANYDRFQGGKQSNLSGDNYYANQQYILGIRYDFNDMISAFSSMGLGFAEAQDAFTKRSRTTATDFTLGGDVKLFSTGILSAVAEIKGSLPFNRQDHTIIDVTTGEGAATVQGGMYLAGDFNWTLVYAYLGVRYQDEGRALLMPWAVHGDFYLGDFIFAGEVSGYSAMTDDDYTKNQAYKNTYNDVRNGGSWRYYAVNPTLIDVKGWVGYQITDDLTARVGYGSSVYGLRTASGQSILFELAFGFDTLSDPTPKSLRKSKTNLRDQFQPDLPKEDDAFRPEPPVRKAPPKKAPQKRRANPSKSLDSIERQLEQKTKRK